MNRSSGEIRAVLDTNLIVSGTIGRSGPPSGVLDSWQQGAFTLITSEPLVAEAHRALTHDRIQAHYGLPSAEIEGVLRRLRAGIQVPLSEHDLPLHCRDPKDDKVLACALGSQADYLVTGDADLLSLDGRPELGALRIVTPRQFLDILDERGDEPDH